MPSQIWTRVSQNERTGLGENGTKLPTIGTQHLIAFLRGRLRTCCKCRIDMLTNATHLPERAEGIRQLMTSQSHTMAEIQTFAEITPLGGCLLGAALLLAAVL